MFALEMWDWLMRHLERTVETCQVPGGLQAMTELIDVEAANKQRAKENVA
jgi:hypothetical protein